MESKLWTGGALALAALALGAVPGASAAVGSVPGDSVDVTVGVGSLLTHDSGFLNEITDTRLCPGTVLDDTNTSDVYRVTVPASCVDGYLVSGEGYGILDEPALSGIEIEGSVVRLPPELTNTESTTVVGDEFHRAYLFDAQASGCSTLTFQLRPTFQTPFPASDLSCQPVCESFNGYQSAVLASEPSLYLPLDGTGRDVSGSQLDVEIAESDFGSGGVHCKFPRPLGAAER